VIVTKAQVKGFTSEPLQFVYIKFERGFMKRITVSLLATLTMGLVMGISKIFLNAPQPAEMLFNFTSRFLGVPWVFNLIHSLPGGVDRYAKYVLYGVTVVIFLAIWFGFGLSYKSLSARFSKWGANLFFVILSVLSVGLVLMPLQGLGAFGLSSNNYFYPPFAAHLWAASFGVVFALVLHLLTHRSEAGLEPDLEKRASLRKIGGGVLLLAGLSVISNGIFNVIAKAQAAVDGVFTQLKGISPELTSVADHYQVSKNVFNPNVPEQNWSLKLTGMVDKELTLTLADLKALPSITRPSTLMCISNEVGGNLIGTSEWTGVKLKDILAMAGVKEGATELILKAADNYSDSFKLDAAMRDGTIVAYLQNGEPLTVDHGFPARVLVPGIYGMKNAKWIVEIELSDQEYEGYWQTRGWSDTAEVQTLSRIDTKEATKLEDGSSAIGGVAFAGIRGISKVEVSIDDGLTWNEADLKPAMNELTWNLWTYQWQANSGEYPALVRATDGAGTLQDPEVRRPLPDGATGYHKVNVKVA
jgi:DMSO/TMAO reductase YedYZ molybdopterin-dependent catalytic subunit